MTSFYDSVDEQEIKKIKEELINFDYSLVDEFLNLFPLNKYNCVWVKVRKTEYEFIYSVHSDHFVDKLSYPAIVDYLFYYESINQFWDNWRRFKKLKLFL